MGATKEESMVECAGCNENITLDDALVVDGEPGYFCDGCYEDTLSAINAAIIDAFEDGPELTLEYELGY
tara:strand:+ start:550 stop:756 length:207 start_codon:yes stop_codon:yes gene_type:complete